MQSKLIFHMVSFVGGPVLKGGASELGNLQFFFLSGEKMFILMQNIVIVSAT